MSCVHLQGRCCPGGCGEACCNGLEREEAALIAKGGRYCLAPQLVCTLSMKWIYQPIALHMRF